MKICRRTGAYKRQQRGPDCHGCPGPDFTKLSRCISEGWDAWSCVSRFRRSNCFGHLPQGRPYSSTVQSPSGPLNTSNNSHSSLTILEMTDLPVTQGPSVVVYLLLHGSLHAHNPSQARPLSAVLSMSTSSREAWCLKHRCSDSEQGPDTTAEMHGLQMVRQTMQTLIAMSHKT